MTNSTPQTTIVTRYETRVHASNRHAGYGIPVVVYADSKQDAINKAVAVGWNGHRGDARVTVDRVTQEVVVLPAEQTDDRPTLPPADRPLLSDPVIPSS